MSSVWWSRKVEGCYAKYRGAFALVESLIVSKGYRETNGTWPEETAKFIELVLHPHREVPLSEIQFEFPEDQYRIVGSELVWGSRDMRKKRWRLGPTSSCYNLSSPNPNARAVSVLQWLQVGPATLTSRAALTDWTDSRPHVYTPRLASIRSGLFTRDIMFAGKKILRFSRTDRCESFSALGGITVPPCLATGWPMAVNSERPYQMPRSVQEKYKDYTPPPGLVLNHEWTRVNTTDQLTEDYTYRWEQHPKLLRPGRTEYVDYARFYLHDDEWVFKRESTRLDDITPYIAEPEDSDDIMTILTAGPNTPE